MKIIRKNKKGEEVFSWWFEVATFIVAVFIIGNVNIATLIVWAIIDTVVWLLYKKLKGGEDNINDDTG